MADVEETNRKIHCLQTLLNGERQNAQMYTHKCATLHIEIIKLKEERDALKDERDALKEENARLNAEAASKVSQIVKTESNDTTALDHPESEDPATIDVESKPRKKNKCLLVRFPCHFPRCGKVFKNVSTLKQHKLLHSNVKRYVCPIENCGKKFQQYASLWQHKKKHHDGKSEHSQFDSKGADMTPRESIENIPLTYSCRFRGCGKMFKSAKYLNQHALLHSAVALHVCPYPNCGKKFHQPAALWQHKKTHSTELLKCDECDAVFLDDRELRYHTITIHHGQTLFPCRYPDCAKKFFQIASLQNHEKGHVSAKLSSSEIL